jgi:hypothetical protein
MVVQLVKRHILLDVLAEVRAISLPTPASQNFVRIQLHDLRKPKQQGECLREVGI